MTVGRRVCKIRTNKVNDKYAERRLPEHKSEPKGYQKKTAAEQSQTFEVLELLGATEFNEVFSGRLPFQDVKFSRRFGKYGEELVAETSENLHTLKRLSAREKFIEFKKLSLRKT
jgi:hypothetical protein